MIQYMFHSSVFFKVCKCIDSCFCFTPKSVEWNELLCIARGFGHLSWWQDQLLSQHLGGCYARGTRWTQIYIYIWQVLLMEEILHQFIGSSYHFLHCLSHPEIPPRKEQLSWRFCWLVPVHGVLFLILSLMRFAWGEEEFKKMRTDPNVMDIFFRHEYLNYTLTWKLRKYPGKRKTPFPNHHHFWDIQVLFSLKLIWHLKRGLFPQKRIIFATIHLQQK